MTKKSIITALIFGALLGVYLVYFKPASSSVQRAAKNPALFQCRSSEEISAFEMTHSQKPLLRLERFGAAWQIVKPYRGNADALIAGGIAVALCQARAVDSMLEPISDLATYGLNDELASKISVYFGDASNSHAFRVGSKHPVRDIFYASWEGDPNKLFFMDGRLVRALDKSEYSLREKRIFHFQDQKIRRVTLNLFGSFVRLFYGLDSRWHLQERPNAELDENMIEELLTHVRGVYVKEFLYDEDPSKPEFGVAESKNVISILWEDGRVEALSIGKSLDERNAYYALKKSEHNPLILVAKPNIHLLVRKPDDFIDRRVVNIEPGDIKSVELGYEGKSDLYQRSADNVWRNLMGKELPGEIQHAIFSMIEEMSLLHYERILTSRKTEDGKIVSFRFLKENQEVAAEFDLVRKGNRCFVSTQNQEQFFQIERADSEVLVTLATLIQSA